MQNILKTLYMYNKQKARKKILLQFFHHSPEVSNVEQSTPLNLAKENPRLKSQSVNSSSAKGKGAIPTTLARRSAGRQSVVRLFGRFAILRHLQHNSTTDAINPIDTPGETTQLKRAYALS